MDIVKVLGMAADSSRKARNIEPINEVTIAAIKWETYSSLQNLLDALAMIVADLGLVKPSTYSELGVVLQEKGIISEADEELIRKIAATRNVIAHTYRKVETEELLQIADDLLPKVEKLCRALMGYVKDSNLDPESAYLSTCTEAFKKNGVKLAYLFGSRARGTSREDSDYDFAVLLSGKATVEDEVKLMLDIADDLHVSVDKINVVILDKANMELAYRILKEGELVYESDEEFRRLWERNTLIKALESRDIYNIYMNRVKKSLHPKESSSRTFQQH